jgi:hypothetical protein
LEIQQRLETVKLDCSKSEAYGIQSQWLATHQMWWLPLWPQRIPCY